MAQAFLVDLSDPSRQLLRAATRRIVWYMDQPSSNQGAPPDIYVSDGPPPPPTQVLDGQRHVAVAVIGAGLTGLSAALHLSQREASKLLC
jgi:hypothetical protein